MNKLEVPLVKSFAYTDAEITNCKIQYIKDCRGNFCGC